MTTYLQQANLGSAKGTSGTVLDRNSFEVNKGGVLNREERRLLVLRAQTGDPEALNVLFESCRKRLYCRAFRILARPQDAEDAVQEAMLAAFTHLDQFQGRADFLTWATQIVTNEALQHIRKTQTKPVVCLDQMNDEFQGASFGKYLKGPQPTPEEQLQGLEHRELLADAVHKLPAESRRAIELCKFADYSLKEAANALGLSVGMLKARLHRGKRALIVRLKSVTQIRSRPAAHERSAELCPASEEGSCAA